MNTIQTQKYSTVKQNYRTKAEATFTYDIPTGPFIKVSMLGADNQYHQISGLLDSGDDVTLLTQETATQLGLTPDKAVGTFKVEGISGPTGGIFYLYNSKMIIGDTPQDQPFPLAIGVGSIPFNLIGRKDVFNKFYILLEPTGKIEFSAAAPPVPTFGLVDYLGTIDPTVVVEFAVISVAVVSVLGFFVNTATAMQH